jgi:hypothetical protein
MDYNKTAILSFSGAMATAGVRFRISFPDDYMIKKIWLVARVQGAQATNKYRLTNVGGGVVYAELDLGTSAVGTVLSADVSEANRPKTGGTVVELRSTVNDASAVVDVFVLCSHNE